MPAHRIQAILLAALARDFPWSALATPAWFESLARRICGLPECVTAFGFESSLSEQEIDLGAQVVAAPGGRAVLASLQMRDTRRDAHEASNGWPRVVRFARDWATPGTRAYDAIPWAFLEFDTSRGLDQLTAPSLFVRVAEHAQFPTEGETDSRRELALELVSTLLDAPLPDPVSRTLQHCVASLPVGSILLHVGVMFARDNGVRLHLSIPDHTLLDYLRAIDWPGDHAAVEMLRKRYGEPDPLVTLQLEVGDGVGAGLGLEFSGHGALQGGATRWTRRFDQLVEDGLCTPAKRDALLAWPAIFTVPLTGGGWPCTIRQDISHVKVVFRPDRALYAKAYISVVPQFPLFAPR
jgi:hypothetical protein